MKELSIEEKAKAYDEAKARMSRAYNDNRCSIYFMNEIFPELKESEDERIRKWIIGVLSTYEHDRDLRNAAIAWLEKQGESIEINPSEFDLRLNRLLKQFESLPKEDLATSLSFYLNVVQNNGTYKEEKQGEQKSIMNVPSREVILSIWDLGNEWEELTNGFFSTKYGTQLDYIQKHWYESEYYLKAKQGEQNHTDKVEPKFHEGEWIACEELNTARIINIDDDKYEVEFIDGNKGFPHTDYIDRNFHLWTIQDAKDGNVLVSNYGKPFIYNGNHNSSHIGAYCGISTENRFNVATEKCYWTGNVNIHPATKEQRDALMKAMTDAGHTFDFEKKELKEIKQRPTWSETDNFMYNRIKNLLTDISIAPESRNSLFYWLKSLKDRVQPRQKWSEEDECYMSECIGAIATKDGWSFEEKRKTKHWLKSLKERIKK